MSRLNFSILATNFCAVKLTCLVTLFDRNLQVFKKSLKLTIFGILDKRWSTQNDECDFFYDFQKM